MAKCMKCGKSTLVRGHVALKDGTICTPCYKALGYKITDAATSKLYTYAEIAGLNEPAPSVNFADYGQERDVNATNEELEIFEAIKKATGRDLCLVRKSDSYVTAVLGEWDLARFKYTQRAKWISFPAAEVGPPKHKIASPEDAAGFAELLAESLAVIDKYQG